MQAYLKTEDPRLDIEAAGLDAVNICAHKIHGPKDRSAVHQRRRQNSSAAAGRRAGTRHAVGNRNLPLAAGFASAAAARKDRLPELERHAQELKTAFWRRFRMSGISASALRRMRAPTSSASVSEASEAKSCCICSRIRVSISQQVRRASTHHKGGHVLKAAGLDREAAEGTVRISTSEFNTPEEIDVLAKALTGQRGTAAAHHPLRRKEQEQKMKHVILVRIRRDQPEGPEQKLFY